MSLPAMVYEVQPANERAAFCELAGKAVYTLVIAPEFAGLLTTRCHWVIESGGRLLNPNPALVELTADKRALGEHLYERGVPALRANVWPGTPITVPSVIKPRHRAGSLATGLVHSDEDASRHVSAAHDFDEWIVQPFVPGRPCSVLCVAGPRQVVFFAPAAQSITSDGTFRYQGGEVPLPAAQAAVATRLARAVARNLPGLSGIFGVDLLLDPGVNRYGGWVVEVNPRLTTSYVGLRALTKTNLAATILAVMAGQKVRLKWEDTTVRFDPDGNILQCG